MNSQRCLTLIPLLIAAGLTGLLLRWADATCAQVPPTQPPSPVVAAAIVTDTDRMIWDAIGINPGDDMYADVAYNSQDGEYLVVFEWPDVDGGPGRDLASIRVEADGQSALSPYSVARSNDYTDTRPAVAYNPTDNSYLAVWEHLGTSGDKEIYGAILNASGIVSGSELPITYWAGDQEYPDVAYATDAGRYLVVWQDDYTAWANRPDIYGLSVDSLGSDGKYASITGIDAPGDQTRPAVATNGANGRWLVTWRDSRNSGTTGDDIYGQQVEFSESGTTIELWGSQVVVGALPGWARALDVAWGQVGSGDGEFLAVWSEDEALYARRVQADNTLPGDVIAVSDADCYKYVPAVAFDPAENTWWTVWADNREKG